MSRSYTKHPISCSNYCKKGKSKKGKILANKKFRRIIRRSDVEFIGKSNFYKKFTRWWEIKGDFGKKPYYLNEYLNDFESLAKHYNEKFDYNETMKMWLKNFYWK